MEGLRTEADKMLESLGQNLNFYYSEKYIPPTHILNRKGGITKLNPDKLEILSAKDIAGRFLSKSEAAREIGVPRTTFRDMVARGDYLVLKKTAEGDWEYQERITKENYEMIRDGKTAIQPAMKLKEGRLERMKKHLRISDPSDLDEDEPESEADANAKKVNEEETLKLQNDILENKCNILARELAKAKKERLITEEVREYILELSSQPIGPAEWILDLNQNVPSKYDDLSGVVGVPTLMLSDVHMGEVVTPSQVFFRNEYNLDIAKRRLQLLTHNTIDTLQNHIVAPKGYPGIVVILGGDMVAGDIHEELTATNEQDVMPCVVQLINELVTMLSTLAEEFGRVEVKCVPGNHGRTTKKVTSKNFAYTNFDWLIGCLLEKFFVFDDRINFCVTDQQDMQYKVYDHTYRLTHGHQFRGGQGFIGALATIIRGGKKKLGSSNSYRMPFDTLVLGHFHTCNFVKGIISNGSVVGFNEYAINGNFNYEEPQQALWLTHPTRGVTIKTEIACDPVDARYDHEKDEEYMVFG